MTNPDVFLPLCTCVQDDAATAVAQSFLGKGVNIQIYIGIAG